MAVPLATVGQKITATIWNVLVAAVNTIVPPGLVQMIPTATGTGVSVGATGTITLAATPVATVVNCFTSAYTNYLVVINLPTVGATANLTLTLAVAGTPTVAANYDYQVFSSSASSVAGAFLAGGTSWPVSATPAVIQDMTFEAFRPQVAGPTQIHQKVWSTPNPAVSGSTAYSMRGFQHRLSTSYDGFVLTTSTGTMSGTITVYGYSK